MHTNYHDIVPGTSFLPAACPAFIGICFNPQHHLKNYFIVGYTYLIHCHVSEHLRHKARALQVQPEVPVKDPGVTPAVCHVLHELPGGEVLAQPLGNHLALVVSVRGDQVETHQEKLKKIENYQKNNSKSCTTSIILLKIVAQHFRIDAFFRVTFPVKAVFVNIYMLYERNINKI